MKTLNKISLGLVSLLFASPALAQDADPEPLHLSALGNILDKVMGYIFPFAGLVCVIFIIIGGYMWLTSAGDPAKVQQAQGTLTWAIIGLVFVLVAVAIIKVITTFVVA